MKGSKRNNTLRAEIERLTTEDSKTKRRWKVPLLFLLVVVSVIASDPDPWVIWGVLCMAFIVFELRGKRRCRQKPTAKVRDVPILLIVILVIFLSAVGLLCMLHRDTLYFLLGTPLGALWFKLVMIIFLTSEALSMSVYLFLEKEESM